MIGLAPRALAAGRSMFKAPQPETPRPKRGAFALDHLLQHPRSRNQNAIRFLCQTVPLPDDVVLCRVLGRYKMHVDARDHGHSPHLMLDGYWEMWVTEAVMQYLRPGMAAWDIGANLGYYTMLFADVVGTGGSVQACEPNPRLAGLLRRSVALNGFNDRVQVHTDPFADQVGRAVSLHVPPGLPQNGSLVPDGALVTTTIDAVVGDAAVDFIKIDVEGSELAIWRGMARLLARGQKLCILLEFTPDRYADPKAFLDEIAACGFAISIVETNGHILPAGVAAVLAYGPSTEDRTLVLER